MIHLKIDYMKWRLLFVLIALSAINTVYAQIPYPGKSPGEVQTTSAKDQLSLENNILKMTFSTVGGKLRVAAFTDKSTGAKLSLNLPVFELTFADGKVVSSDAFVLKKKPALVNIPSYDSGSGRPGKAGGRKYQSELEDPKTGINIHWEAILTEDANYIREVITFAVNKTVKLVNISMIKLPGNIGVKAVGTVDGSPLVHKTMFFASEHPMSRVREEKGYISSDLPRLEPLTPGSSFTTSAVWGVTPKGQLRRGFLCYVEKERAMPYRQMLHYNSWYDISWGDRKLNEAVCLDRIKTFGDSLVQKRNVHLKAFLFDDGWDDNKSLWQFNPGFPKGFTELKKAAASYQAGIGVWISPWGGYDEAKEQRLNYGKQQNPPFETNANGFSLSGPVYNKRFNAVTSNFIKEYNVSMFKFDGVGAGNGASGASITYQKDIESFLNLISGMRKTKPDLYFSLTVGTWPSVYWLNYGDAIWRAGEDTGLSGRGTKRQQWINYRDAQTYKNVVKRAPLYPLNSLMNHGICIADNGLPGGLETDNQNVEDEIWSFFGTGTSLQELYINPHKLDSKAWDCLRDAASWAKANEQVLADVHWAGGDPDKEEVYGFAAWRDQKGVLTLRNPSPVEKSFTVNVRQLFEIPGGLGDSYSFYDARLPGGDKLFSGRTAVIKLKPFEVKVMNAMAD
ncbi:hypothetical protein BDE36_3804 [Arcticibacter tournemirensis]|nr:enterotoxin [Arcticibacter tournemirensis]TQM52007.1 hypothetical protein BDE36_3804 [Arcticibacter tournemirensis]